MSAISSSINKMQQLEKLQISGVGHETFIDLDVKSPPPRLQRVKFCGHFKKFPKWISKLRNLVKLRVMLSKQGNDAMKLLQSMPNLLSLHITGSHDYEDKLESLHFQDGWFMNLKELTIFRLDNLSYILIDEGALGSLKKLNLYYTPRLKMLPTGIQYLHNLEVLRCKPMSVEFMQSIGFSSKCPL
jgi:disease resistance protein RPM1